jgi:COP9 signalosome complex subunit 2
LDTHTDPLTHTPQATEHYEELLTYVKSVVTRNYAEKSIDNMLNFVEKNSHSTESSQCLEKFYSLTLQCFQATNNERLWLKTNIKLSRLLLDRKDYPTLSRKLRDLHKACQREDGSDDPGKGTYSLEIYALEIQMYVETKNSKQLKRLYQRALKVRSAVPHPKIMGVIRECGGKMHMTEESWPEAQKDFFESFKNYDEAGDVRRIQVLKYLLLTTMLNDDEINPFDSQETKPYRSDPRIKAMTDLVDAYQHDDIHRYEDVLSSAGKAAAGEDRLLDDPFIAENIDEVTRNMRTKAVLKLVAPYTRMRVGWVAAQLRIGEPEVLDIVGFLIVDGRVKGKIDQAAGTLEMEAGADAEHVAAVSALADSVGQLYRTIFRDGEGFRASPAGEMAGLYGGGEGSVELGGGGSGGGGGAERLGTRAAGRRRKGGAFGAFH